MKLSELLQFAIDMSKPKDKLLEIKNNASILTEQKQEVDEEFALAKSILAQKQDGCDEKIKDILNVLSHCAQATLNPKKSMEEFFAIKSSDHLYENESKETQQKYEKLINESKTYTRSRKTLSLQPELKKSTTISTKSNTTSSKVTPSSAHAIGDAFLQQLKKAQQKRTNTQTDEKKSSQYFSSPTPNQNTLKFAGRGNHSTSFNSHVQTVSTSTDQSNSSFDKQKLEALEQKYKQLQQEFNTLQNKLNTQESSIQKQLKESVEKLNQSELKRLEAETKLQLIEKRFKGNDRLYNVIQDQVDTLIQKHIDYIAEDKSFDVVYTVTYNALSPESQRITQNYIRVLHEEYKGIYQHMLLGDNQELRTKKFSDEFHNELYKDLEDRIKQTLYGYDLELMSQLPDNDINNAQPGKIYLSEHGNYAVLDSKGKVQKGSLSDSSLDLKNLANRLNDEMLKKKILEITSKAGHTPPDYKTEAMKKADKICTDFFKMMMVRLERMKKTSPLAQLAQQTRSLLSEEHKVLILKAADEKAKNMAKEYIQNIVNQALVNTSPNSTASFTTQSNVDKQAEFLETKATNNAVSLTTSTLFQPSPQPTEKTDTASYTTAITDMISSAVSTSLSWASSWIPNLAPKPSTK